MRRRREPRPAIVPRRRGPPLSPGDRDRRLAEEVLYLHSLWHRGTPAPARAPIQSRPAGLRTPTNKRQRLDSAAAAAPIQSRSAGLKTAKNKRQRRDSAAAAAPQDSGAEWPTAPPPPDSSPKTWPEPSSPRANPPRHPRSPGVLMQWKALRAAAEFLSNHGATSDDDDGGSGSEGEQDVAGFITGLFERDAALRGHYERGRGEAEFKCIACAGGRRPGRRFRGCVALVQHARDASKPTRYGRPRAHRALAAVLCRVLGWDIEKLPAIVMDPRGTLGQELAARGTASDPLAKENGDTGENSDSSSDEDEEEDVETGMEDSSTDFDEEDNDLEGSEESFEKEDVENGTDDSENIDDDEEEEEAIELDNGEQSTEKVDVENGTEDSNKIDVDEEAIELDNGEQSTEKEEKEEKAPSSWKEISKNEVLHNESVQEVNASEVDSLNQDNNGEVHKLQLAKESSEQENTNGSYLLDSNEEHCTEGSVQKEENVDENKEEHVESTS